jgi:hypothetical protein
LKKSRSNDEHHKLKRIYQKYQELLLGGFDRQEFIRRAKKLKTELDKASADKSANDRFHSSFTNQLPADKLDVRDLTVKEAIARMKIQVNVAIAKGCDKLYVVTSQKTRYELQLKMAVVDFAKAQKIHHYESLYNPECVVFVLQPKKNFVMKIVTKTAFYAIAFATLALSSRRLNIQTLIIVDVKNVENVLAKFLNYFMF